MIVGGHLLKVSTFEVTLSLKSSQYEKSCRRLTDTGKVWGGSVSKAQIHHLLITHMLIAL